LPLSDVGDGQCGSVVLGDSGVARECREARYQGGVPPLHGVGMEYGPPSSLTLILFSGREEERSTLGRCMLLRREEKKEEHSWPVHALNLKEEKRSTLGLTVLNLKEKKKRRVLLASRSLTSRKRRGEYSWPHGP